MRTPTFATPSVTTDLMVEALREFFLGPVHLFRSRPTFLTTITRPVATAVSLTDEELPSVRRVATELANFVLMVALGTLQFVLILGLVLVLQRLPYWLPQTSDLAPVWAYYRIAGAVLVATNLLLFLLYLLRAAHRALQNLLSPPPAHDLQIEAR